MSIFNFKRFFKTSAFSGLGGTVFIFLFLCCSPTRKITSAGTFNEIEKQTQVMLSEISKVKAGDNFSPRTIENGNLKLVASRDWTSGFFPGILWYLYEYTGDQNWKEQARNFTASLEREKTNAGSI